MRKGVIKILKYYIIKYYIIKMTKNGSGIALAVIFSVVGGGLAWGGYNFYKDVFTGDPNRPIEPLLGGKRRKTRKTRKQKK